MMTLRVLSTALLISTTACLPKSESNSAVKFDAATAGMVGDLLTDSMMKKFCGKTPVFFFFGNAEPIVALMGDRAKVEIEVTAVVPQPGDAVPHGVAGVAGFAAGFVPLASRGAPVTNEIIDATRHAEGI